MVHTCRVREKIADKIIQNLVTGGIQMNSSPTSNTHTHIYIDV